MSNLKEVAYDTFQPLIEEKQENIEPAESSKAPAESSKVDTEKLFTPENIKQGRPITIESIRIDFPLKPYPAQVQMMSKIIHSLKRKENAVLESPTGSGKSLALLCATLAWRQNEEQLAMERIVKRNQEGPQADSSMRDPEGPKENNKREREEQDDNNKNSNNNKSNTSFDSDFQSQTRPEEKKPKYEETKDKKTFPEAPRRKLPWRTTQPVGESFSVQQHSYENYSNNSKKNNGENSNSPSVDSNGSTPKKANLKYEVYNEIPRIFVGSRTHKQLTQLVNELKGNTSYKPRMTILGSREQLCIHPQVSKSGTKADDCNALLEKKKCIYGQNSRRLMNHPLLKTTKRVWDIEDLVKLGRGVRGCPYFAARKMYEGAEIIFCPYNYIIDPIIRSSLDIQLKNSVIIIDEAHNIEDFSRSAGSFEVNENELKILSLELTQIIRGGFEKEAHDHILYLIESLLEWVSNKDNTFSIKEYEQYVNVWSGAELLQRLDGLGIKNTTFEDTIKPAFKKVYGHAQMIRRENEDKNINSADDDGQVQIHKRKCVSNNGLSVLQALIMIFGFFFEQDKTYSFDYRMALIKKIDRGGKKKKVKKAKSVLTPASVFDPSEWNYKLCFWCLNPGAIFRQLTENSHSVILTSGTLSPMNTFESELQTKFNSKLEANHVISPSQVWVGTIPVGPNHVGLRGTYNNIESFQYQDDIGEALYQILTVVPFGVLCFFPSYNTLEKLTARWKNTGLLDRMIKKKLVLTEPRKTGKNELEKEMKKYNDQITAVENDSTETEQTGSLMFGVFRGKISEGIDFTDNSCRAVISIGIPFPGFKDIEVNLKKKYNDQKRTLYPQSGILSGSEWYCTQAYRAINQALGRCIRHKNDWGAIILLEERFQAPEHISRLSKWIKNQHRNFPNFNMAINSLDEFSSGHKRRDVEARKMQKTGSLNQFSKTEVTVASTSAPKDSPKTQVGLLNTLNVTVESTISNSGTGPIQTNATENGVTTDTKMDEDIPMIISNDEQRNPVSSIDHQNDQNQIISSMDGSDIDDEFGFSFDIDPNELSDMELYSNIVSPNQQAGGLATQRTMATAETVTTTCPPSAPITSSPIVIDLVTNDLPPFSAPVSNQYTSVSQGQVVELLICGRCDRNLVSGFAKDRMTIMNNTPLHCISYRSGNTPFIIELNKPGSWIIQDNNLVGGPLGLNVLPHTYNADVDTIDKLCYRVLRCKCDMNVAVGVTICAALDNTNKEYVGKVYLWNELIKITTRKPIVVPHNRQVLETESDIHIMSQRTNMNDMFYNLP